MDETDLPQRSGVGARTIVRVESINTVVLGRDEEDVMRAFVDDGHVRDIKRLGINVTVHGVGEQSAERRAIDIRKRQNGFIRILSGARVVVVLRPNAYLRRR